MIKFFTLILLFSYYTGISQTCNTFGFLKKGAELEMTSFDSKGKVVSKATSTVLDVVNKGGDVEAKVETKTLNEKGKELMSGNVTLVCNGSYVSFSMKNMMAGDQTAMMKNMEVKVDETMLDYPNNMSVGNTLKDGNFKAEMFSGGMKLMTMNFNITNRKVLAEESITTPAGTFKCYKITYLGNMKTIVNMNFDATEWYSPKVGLVKSETTRNGKPMGSTMLTQTNVN